MTKKKVEMFWGKDRMEFVEDELIKN